MQDQKNNENGIELDQFTTLYENSIAAALDQYIQERDIEDMRKEPQSRWNAALMYINKLIFKGHRDRLLVKPYDAGNLKYGGVSNNNKYDLYKINKICDIYINLCYEFDKETSLIGFEFLTGISDDTMRSWHESSTSDLDVYKKLMKNREEFLNSVIISGKRNPVGAIASLNNNFGWQEKRTVVHEQKFVNAPTEIGAIMAEFGIMSDNSSD